MKCCALQTLNNFDLYALMFPKVVLTMDTYRFGKVKKSLPFEMGFADAFTYLAFGEYMQLPVTDFELIVFTRLLNYNQRLVYLDLSSNLMKDYGLIALSEWLFTNSSLKYLNLVNNDLNWLHDQTLDTFMDALA